MPEPTYKIVEIVGTSEVSISKAIEGAIAKASGSLRHLGWFEVGQIRGNISDGKAQPLSGHVEGRLHPRIAGRGTTALPAPPPREGAGESVRA